MPRIRGARCAETAYSHSRPPASRHTGSGSGVPRWSGQHVQTLARRAISTGRAVSLDALSRLIASRETSGGAALRALAIFRGRELSASVLSPLILSGPVGLLP